MRTIIWVALCLAISRILLGQGGMIDPTFNPKIPDGVILINVLLEQPDGKILVGGSLTFGSANTNSRPLSRFDRNGSVDSDFHQSVISGNVNAIALDSAGRILAGGDFSLVDGHSYPGIVRLLPDGSVDGTFQPDRITRRTASGAIKAILVQSDDLIVIGGSFDAIAGLPRLGVARLFADGKTDPTYGGTNLIPQVSSLILEKGGTILAVGDPAGLARMDSNGVQRFVRVTYYVFPSIVAEQPDGKILAINSAGFQVLDFLYTPGMVRLFPDGRIDWSFRTRLDQIPYLGVAVQPDGKILLAVTGPLNGTPITGLVRLQEDGSIDPAFSIPSFTDQLQSTAISIQRDGDILVGRSGFLTSRVARVRGGNRTVVGPTIQVQPRTQTAVIGNNVSLTVSASGYPLAFRWKKNGLGLLDETNATLNLENINDAAIGNYSVTITNALGTVESALAALSVLPSSSAPNLIVNPSFEVVPAILPDPPYLPALGPPEGWNGSLYAALFRFPEDVPRNFFGSQIPLHGSNYAGLFCTPGFNDFEAGFLTGTLTQPTALLRTYEVTLGLSLADFSAGSCPVVRVSMGTGGNELMRIGYFTVTNTIDWQIYTQRFVSDRAYGNIDIRGDGFTGGFVYVDNVSVREMVDFSPLLSSVPDQFVNFGTTLNITNALLNPGANSAPWRFSLDADAPPGARIDSDTGIFSWTPETNDIGSSVLITVRATQANSARTAVTAFEARVGQALVNLGNIAMDAGQAGFVPINVTFNANVVLIPSNLTFRVRYPAALITNLSTTNVAHEVRLITFENLQPGLAQVTILFAGTPVPKTLEAASLTFQTLSNIASVVALLKVEDPVLTVWRLFPDALPVAPNVQPSIGPGGRVIIGGEAPLLEIDSSAAPKLLVRAYGKRGVTYEIQSASTLATPGWQSMGNVTLTNTAQVLIEAQPQSGVRFYRLRKN